ncbi:hypothetical protein C349_03544 [Cryptococcus neoformans var. grubii Br795]|uniref:Uncharacterized protein n=1 Tax=Cryptococcus neoformans Tu259-1 TaxID=1230072 RepID=A0A854QE20_CRYNE|nr:hypothetical protein C368_03570 [Cryptococcus neoformans var. grubii 125.91]OXG20839.1 hypothetical protein C361_03818 [Cryptococcus neoformans var. grubii Tu259-1]OXG50078.1 hypothetical protein C355_03042 [Cryptococcus neoformans var. grubii Th84]OXG82235.1 hypothetical protein C349_03544 [Cryptococcus neoformans var. grubii Br795]OXH10474.1 hypothetical protein J010_03420 [Cryptococcus neoformans var. grubii]
MPHPLYSRSSPSSTSSSESDSHESSISSYSLPRFTEKSRQYSFTQRASARFKNALRPTRRSSLPFVHVARRRTTQLALATGLFILGALLLSEFRYYNERQQLWNLELALQEWEVRHPGDREVNLFAFRADYESKRREEMLAERKRSVDSGSLDKEQLWTAQEDETLQREVNDKWPSWWGNPDVVGKSPFDHRPALLPPRKEKRRLLMLTDYKDYLERMNTHTYEIVDAALRHPHLIVDVWGPGWAGYNKSIPLSANIRKRAHRVSQLEKSKNEFEKKQRKKRGNLAEGAEQEVWQRPAWLDVVPDECSDVRYDVVLTISNIYKETDPHLDFLDCGALMVQQIGDCHSLRCAYEWYPQSNNITLSKYAFELLELFDYDKVKAKYPDWEMGLFGHSPDTGNEWDFWPVTWSEKTSDATIFGFDGSFYPIRTTVTNHLRDAGNKEQETLISRHPHPGYTVSVPQEARDNPLETYEQNHQYYTTHLKLREDFARGMRESKICVFDASLERKLIRKYAQAFLSGCVVAADIPTEHESALSKFVIPLKATWSIEQINAAIQYYIDRPEVLQQMAVDGFVYARQHLTTTNKISHILEMADHYREGSRGYEFPYGFSMRCRAYWSDENGYRPPWCRNAQGYRGLED